MGRAINIEPSSVFARLTTIQYAPSKNGHKMVKCVCECGKEVITRASALVSGNTKSCGCLNDEMCKAMAKSNTHLFVYDENGNTKPEYNTYRHLKARCYNPKNKKYKDYGARGIKVCDRWLESYANFISDMGPKPGPEYTLDRINVNGNYEPSNCQWAIPVVQSNNQRRNVFLELDGFKISQAQLAKLLSINAKSVEFHRKRGLTAQQIIDKYKNPDYVIKFEIIDSKIFAKD